MAGTSAKNQAKISFVAECKEFNANIRTANAVIKEMRSEIALSAETMKRTGDEVGALQAQQSYLTEAFEAAGDKVENLQGKLEAAVRNYGEGSEQVSKWSAELAKAKTEQEKFRQQLEACNSSLEAAKAKLAASETSYEQLNRKIADQRSELSDLKQQYVEAVVNFGATSKEAQELAAKIQSVSGNLKDNEARMKEVRAAADSLDQTITEQKTSWQRFKEGVHEVSDAFGDFKKSIQGVCDFVDNQIKRAFSELMNLTKDVASSIVENGIKTESSFAKVQAVMNATDEDMAKLKAASLELQDTLPYTMNESATAMYYMGLAGWDAEQSIAALSPTLALVTASGEDLSRVSDILTDNITAFGLSAEDAQYMADVLAQTMRSTNTDVDLLGDTFKYAAAPAHAAGYALEDVALAAGLMANNGIKGSQAGTALRQMFVSLAKPSENAAEAMKEMNISLTDSDGRMKSLKEFLDDTRVSFAGLSVELLDADGNLREYDDILQELEETNQDYAAAEKLKNAALIFGTRAMPGILSMINMSEEEYKRVTEEIYNYNGACEEAARIMNDTLEGDIKMLNASLDTLGMQIYNNVSPKLREFVQQLTDWVKSDQSAALIDQIGGELKKLLDGVLQDLPNIITNISTILQGIPSIISAVANAITWITGHINGIISAIKAIIVVWGAVKVLGVIGSISRAITNLITFISTIKTVITATKAATAAQVASNAAMSATPWGLVAVGAAAAVSAIVLAIQKIKSWNDNTAECNNRIKAVTSNLKPFCEGLNQLTEAFKLSTGAASYLSEVDQTIADEEQHITEVIRQAVADHRELRMEEVDDINKSNEKIRELEQQKADIYRESAINTGYEIQAAMQAAGGLSIEEAQKYTATLRGYLDQANEATDNAMQAELQRVSEYYKSIGQAGSEEHMAALEETKRYYAAQKEENESQYREQMAKMTDYYAQVLSADKEMWDQRYANSNKGREQYTSNLEQMDLDTTKAFLGMVMTARENGVVLSSETEAMATSILNSFANLPSELCGQGRTMILSMISGMEDQFPQLRNAGEMSYSELIGTLKEIWEIPGHSTAVSTSGVMERIGITAIMGMVQGMNEKAAAANATAKDISEDVVSSLTPSSKETESIGENVITGIGEGMEDKESWLGRRVKSIATGLVDTFKSLFKIGSPSRVMAEEIGQWLPAGIGEGIEDNAGAAMKPLKGLVSSMTGGLTGLNGLADGYRLDVGGRIDSHIQDAFNNNSQLSLLDRMTEALERITNLEFVINMNINGDRIAQATASAVDNVSGSRVELRQRGLALG